MGQISKFFNWREYFAPELDTSGSESFSPGFFNYFGRPTAESFDSVFLTSMGPKSMFGLFHRCATRNGLKKPPLMAG